eukprot:7377622-Prymnesium_polylepis.1
MRANKKARKRPSLSLHPRARHVVSLLLARLRRVHVLDAVGVVGRRLLGFPAAVFQEDRQEASCAAQEGSGHCSAGERS